MSAAIKKNKEIKAVWVFYQQQSNHKSQCMKRTHSLSKKKMSKESHFSMINIRFIACSIQFATVK